jgi:hypothetical protein
MHQAHKKEYTKAWIIRNISLISIDIFLELYSAPFKMDSYTDDDKYITRKFRSAIISNSV